MTPAFNYMTEQERQVMEKVDKETEEYRSKYIL